VIIKDYKQKEMCKVVRDLFLAIYPKKPELAERMCFDENMNRHIATKVAIINNKVVGQANVFLMKEGSEIANLGYHVHPDFHKKGIGKKLSEEIIKIAKKKRIKILLIRTDGKNVASINLGKKLGFVKPPKEFLEKNRSLIEHKNIKNMVCLYKLL
jgi:GNAT superfamily N-acetyltransferase